MAQPPKTYIRQIKFNGSTYDKGTTVELLESYHVVCEEFPFILYPEPKELPTRNWLDQHGLDAYIPDELPLKEYEIEVKFLYVKTRLYNGSGTAEQRAAEEAAIRQDIKDFISFLYGRKKGGSGVNEIQSPRLAIYNTYTAIGRKDVVISKVGNDVFFFDDQDDDVIAEFSIKFTVLDPVTDVTLRNGVIDWEWPTT